MNKIKQLDALRGLAGPYVLCHHIASSYLRLQHVWYGQPFRFGQEAVIVFFLLSGFVIRISSGPVSEPIRLRPYFVRRLRRIYPIFLASLALTYLCLSIKSHVLVHFDVGEFLGNMSMLQDSGSQRPGITVLPFMGNDPLWSLSYEWWFYLFFVPLTNYASATLQKYVVFGLSIAGSLTAIFAPCHFAYVMALLLVWWAGVELGREYEETGGVTLRRQASMILMLGVLAGLWAVVCAAAIRAHQELNQMRHPAWELRWFSMAAIFLLLLFFWRKLDFWSLGRTLGIFAPFAHIAYALYVFHFPILCYLDFTDQEGSIFADILIKVALIFALSYVMEVHVQYWINRSTRWPAPQKLIQAL